jgi:minor extracellular serine protease Vpr
MTHPWTSRFLLLSTLAVGITELRHGVAAPVSFRDETGANAAEAKYGSTGAGATVVIMDRGIDWDHPDFIKPDGTTRIKWLYDMSPEHPSPIEYSEVQINAALAGGPPINSRDAVGHGTVTAGLAAGNGAAVTGSDFRGMAPGADLIIIKVTSEGAPAHDDQPAEAAFNASYIAALDWLDAKLNTLGQPAVALFNSGTQWGPIDGTSAVSRKINEVFGPNRPGRAYVAAAGDEGAAANHARATFDGAADTVVELSKIRPETTFMQMWYPGDAPAEITVEFDDGTVVGPLGPNEFLSESGVTLHHYAPNAGLSEFLNTDNGDHFVYVDVAGHQTSGRVRIRGTSAEPGVIDLYASIDGTLTSPMPFSDHLAPGRLSDFASTASAIVSGAHVLQTHYIDVDGIPREVVGEGAVGELWPGSSGGPTRDGREFGVDVTAPGHGAFAAYAQESYWSTFRFNLADGGDGWYGRGGATSGSAPLVVGAVALLLAAAPDLTSDQVRDLLRTTTVSDDETGPTPNLNWGFGKLNVLHALDELVARGWAAPGYLGGDFNRDRQVDADDLTLWRSAFAVNGSADGDGDGDSDGADFLIWQRQLGMGSSIASQAPIPEPATRIMILLGILAMLNGRRDGGVISRRSLASC